MCKIIDANDVTYIKHTSSSLPEPSTTLTMKNSKSQNSSLHHCHVHTLRSILYTTHSLCQSIAIIFILYFRATFFFENTYYYFDHQFFLRFSILCAELSFSFFWFLKQPFYWRPVTRTVFPENLPNELRGIDVFICTADPKKEPTFDVMNTVVSAMALDYPAEKLCVYLSDDAYACVTLDGMKEAWVFATWWLPFVRRYGVKSVCPKAYFEQPKEGSEGNSDYEFIQERNIIKEKYEAFKSRVQSMSSNDEIIGGPKTSVKDHPAHIQVIDANAIEDETAIINTDNVDYMPSLVYVSREKRSSHPHHFKAGALNVLLRVSATMSYSPYILVLDCDMYCNDSISSRQAMCFFLDPKISPTLGWVQYPQTFHNVNEHDIYDSQMRYIWTVYWPGADGLQGPTISGTNFYINRKALYGFDLYNGSNIKGARDIFGPYYVLFNKSLSQSDFPNTIKNNELCSNPIKEALSMASCTYEDNTKWGDKVGFQYESVVEDALTGFMLQAKGWRSVYLNPTRQQFLGSATTNLNELLIQNSRWSSGVLEIGLSKYWRIFCSSSRMKIPHKISSSWVALHPLCSIPAWCLVTIHPIGFLFGTSSYPKVSDPYFLAFAFVFISSILKNLCEVVTTRAHQRSISSFSIALNEESAWLVRLLTCYVHGFVDFIMTILHLRKSSFIPTNKSDDNDTRKLYEMGKYDFRTSNMFLVPLVTMVCLNICCFVGGITRLAMIKDFDSMFAQAFFSFYVLLVSFPIIEAMFLRQDIGCIPLLVTLKSTLYSVILLSFGYIFFLY